MTRKKDRLPSGTELDQYVIEKAIGGGGFSLVYLARERPSNERVVIKEYMPQKLARRNRNHQVVTADGADADRFQHGRASFFHEARVLAELAHPNIVRVVNFFQANGTVYMVMAYEPGKNLQRYITYRGGRLSERFMRTVFPPLLDGLRALHGQGLLHLDIKPANIHLRPGGRPLLIDFGAVHRRDQSRRFQVSQVISPGYSPIEQAQPKGYVGPWTDIYALGATMRSCIEGRPPPPAPERHVRDTLRPAAELYRRQYSPELLRALDWAMEVEPLLRPQRVEDLLAALGGETVPGATAASGAPVGTHGSGV
ncbi:MAG: serine/threonine protein kinase [Gammaproteobacteria bacterium]|nr:serine/threonine protein kinase [Gammaproteobacteria bacterium]